MLRWISSVSHFGISCELNRFRWNLRRDRVFLFLLFFIHSLLILSFLCDEAETKKKLLAAYWFPHVKSFKRHLTATVCEKQFNRKKGPKIEVKKIGGELEGQKITCWTCLYHRNIASIYMSWKISSHSK